MIKALLFDMDGLLLDSERVVQESWNVAGETLGYGKVGEHIYNTLGMNVVGRKEYFCKVFGQEFPYEEFQNLSRKAFFKVADQEGIPLKPGAKELIFYAKQMGYKVGLVTSSRKEYAVDALKKAGIFQYFDGCIFGDMVSKSKPNPEIYEKGCKMLGEEPEWCIAFEDAPAGVIAATDAGIDVIMVPDLVQPDEETRMRTWKVLRSLDEAIGLLRMETRE